MSTLDEDTAWRLLRALPAGGAEGEGSQRVRVPDAWLEVRASGDWEASLPATDAARDLIDLFLPLLLPARVVVAQLGQSLDGRIATESGHSHYVTGPEDIRRLHRLRALVDAVVVGAGTVASDDPRLTVREVDGKDPVRVVLDPESRLDPGHRIFSHSDGQTLVIQRASSERAWAGDHVEALTLPHTPPHGFEPAEVVRALRDRGMRRILVEGGGVTVSRFLDAGVLDRLHVTVAPLLIGSGRPALTLPPVETLDRALRPPCRCFRLGRDVLFDLELGSSASGRGGRGLPGGSTRGPGART